MLEQYSSFSQNRIFNIFNIIVKVATVTVVAMGVFLVYIGAYTQSIICLGEMVMFYGLLKMHIRGYYVMTRYAFFVFTNLAQVYGSLYHGENGGFDFYFIVNAIVPVIFFEKKYQYISLFALSVMAFIIVKILYGIVPPILPFEGKFLFPYYANIILATFFMFLGYNLFKSEHMKYERQISLQSEEILKQKEKLVALKDQLEAHLVSRTKEVEVQGNSIKQYAFLNAHKVRSPLARIQGLINLTELEDMSDADTREFYMKQLQKSVEELDAILNEVNTALNEGVKS